MRILVLSTVEEAPLFVHVQKGLAREFGEGTIPLEIVTDGAKFSTALSCFKIISSDSPDTVDGYTSDLVWPSVTKFLKDATLKAKVWDDVKTILVEKAKIVPVKLGRLGLSVEQIQHLLEKIGDSKAPFVFEDSDGRTIGVNMTKHNAVDYQITSGDLASMLTASWIFGAVAVRLDD